MRPDVGFVVGANGGAVVISLSSSSRCVTTTQKIYFCLIIKTLREILLIFLGRTKTGKVVARLL